MTLLLIFLGDALLIYASKHAVLHGRHSSLLKRCTGAKMSPSDVPFPLTHFHVMTDEAVVCKLLLSL